MTGGRRFLALAVCLCLITVFTAPAFAAGRDVDTSDLKGISPKRHRYIFTVLGGAAVGAGIGMAMGSEPSVAKGALIGSGLMSSWYLATHRDNLGGWRNWAQLGSYTALGAGLGWTACKCGDGAGIGALIGGGTAAIWQASKRDSGRVARTPTNKPTTTAGEPQ